MRKRSPRRTCARISNVAHREVRPPQRLAGLILRLKAAADVRDEYRCNQRQWDAKDSHTHVQRMRIIVPETGVLYVRVCETPRSMVSQTKNLTQE